MDVLTVCMRCHAEQGAPDFATFAMSAVPDDLVIRQECPAGHVTHTVLQNDKFELLSELALLAVIDCYYREAVVNFSAMIERLQEFYLRVIAEHRGVSEDMFARAWKPLSSLSERQAGAFAMTYAFEHGGAAPQLRSDTEIKFRNDVVHKGKFPGRSETITYGQACFDLAEVVLHELKAEKYADALQRVVMFRLRDGYTSARNASASPSTYAMQTPLCLTTAVRTTNVEEAIASITARPPVRQLADLAAALRQVVSDRPEADSPGSD